jgi:hypothetical protein
MKMLDRLFVLPSLFVLFAVLFSSCTVNNQTDSNPDAANQGNGGSQVGMENAKVITSSGTRACSQPRHA